MDPKAFEMKFLKKLSPAWTLYLLGATLIVVSAGVAYGFMSGVFTAGLFSLLASGFKSVELPEEED